MSNKLTTLLLVLVFISISLLEGLPQRFGNWVKGESFYKSMMAQAPLPESLSGTLRGPLNSAGELTLAGVVEETNKQRASFNKKALAPNVQLNQAAQAKVDDMFKQQYFEHISPDGKHPVDLIKAAGYDYLVVGENLALGNFENDAALVDAWMNSPGHRANILDGKFEQIGVAVAKGKFQGDDVWLAVQEFGTPGSSCPNPGNTAKAQIDQNHQQIVLQQADLDALKKQIDAKNYSTRSDYDAAVAQYNAQASDLNNLIDRTKILVDVYNSGVNLFNSCLRSGT